METKAKFGWGPELGCRKWAARALPLGFADSWPMTHGSSWQEPYFVDLAVETRVSFVDTRALCVTNVQGTSYRSFFRLCVMMSLRWRGGLCKRETRAESIRRPSVCAVPSPIANCTSRADMGSESWGRSTREGARQNLRKRGVLSLFADKKKFFQAF